MSLAIMSDHHSSLTTTRWPRDKSSSKSHADADAAMEDHDDDGDSNTSVCPLFMQGLPQNFSTNPQLAAIASLLEDAVQEEEEEKQQHPSSVDHCNTDSFGERKTTDSKKYVYKCVDKKYAKAKRVKYSYTNSNTRTNHPPKQLKTTTTRTPFPTPTRKGPASSASTSTNNSNNQLKSSSVGETMLFLNMWKL
jgi:hypothetical protein